MLGDVVERCRDLVDHRGLRIGLAVVAVVVVGGWWFLAGAAPETGPGASGQFTAGGTTIPFATSTTGDGAASSAGSDPGGGAQPGDDVVDELLVHAAGAVVTPGVHRLPPGARIGDLVAAAGGLAADADADRLNLAEPLRDGVRVYVPRRGETETPSPQGIDGPSAPTPSGGGGPGSPPAGSPGSPGSSGGSGPLDLNSATLDQLVELPGIGPATAQAILSHRDQHGPFGSVDELLEVRGIGPAKLEQLRTLVRA